jgi:hypothetical protein
MKQTYFFFDKSYDYSFLKIVFSKVPDNILYVSLFVIILLYIISGIISGINSFNNNDYLKIIYTSQFALTIISFAIINIVNKNLINSFNFINNSWVINLCFSIPFILISLIYLNKYVSEKKQNNFDIKKLLYLIFLSLAASIFIGIELNSNLFYKYNAGFLSLLSYICLIYTFCNMQLNYNNLFTNFINLFYMLSPLYYILIYRFFIDSKGIIFVILDSILKCLLTFITWFIQINNMSSLN